MAASKAKRTIAVTSHAEKAFVSFDWHYKFEFGDNFIHWVRALYKTFNSKGFDIMLEKLGQNVFTFVQNHIMNPQCHI